MDNRGIKYIFIIVITLFISFNIFGKTESKNYKYSLKKLYSTAIRFIVIDNGCKILDKDIEGAYIIFDCKNNSPQFSGKIEIVEKNDEGVNFILHFEGPSYKRIQFFKKLNNKLKTENDKKF